MADAEGLSVRGLSCAVGYRQLFAELDFDLAPATWMALIGPNGCGKSTLLRTIAGLRDVQSGEIRWRGEPVGRLGGAWRATLVYQGHLPGWKDALTPTENLGWQLALDGLAADAGAIAGALARVGLARQARLPFARLSAGQRRRVGLARLAALPVEARPLWLLDEPATALDQDGLALLAALVDAHLDKGGCAIVATHQALAGQRAPARLELGRYAAAHAAVA